MLLSKIKELFSYHTTLRDFKKNIESEIHQYEKNLAKKGSSSPILLTEDIQSINIRSQDVKFICEAFLNSQIDKWELNYLAEGIMLSERSHFENDAVKEAFDSLTDPEFFQLVSARYIKQILDDLFVR